MQKQILYPSLVPRLFATNVDFLVMFFIFSPILAIVNKWLFIYKFKDFLVHFGINTKDDELMNKVFYSPNFLGYYSQMDIISYVLMTVVFFLISVAIYYIYFWHRHGWTPGKLLLGFRVVDEESLSKLSILACIKRLFGAAFFMVGVWFIPFTSKHQALHDKLAGSVVIKG
jgi:uncharacterized RDD family membrane protein YckC